MNTSSYRACLLKLEELRLSAQIALVVTGLPRKDSASIRHHHLLHHAGEPERITPRDRKSRVRTCMLERHGFHDYRAFEDPKDRPIQRYTEPGAHEATHERIEHFERVILRESEHEQLRAFVALAQSNRVGEGRLSPEGSAPTQMITHPCSRICPSQRAKKSARSGPPVPLAFMRTLLLVLRYTAAAAVTD